MIDDFKNKVLSGISWSFISQGGTLVLQFIVGVILARLLTPEDFGIIGMITVFSSFAGLFTDMGLGAALVQKQDTEPIHYHTTFWINLVAGLIITLVFIFSAPLIAAFYNEPILKSLTIFLAFNFFLGSLGIIHRMIFKKNLSFKKLAIQEILAILFPGIVAIWMALVGYGVWSLAVQSVLSTAVGVILLWKMNNWRPSFQFSYGAFKELWEFSSNLLGFNTINYWFRNADNLLIGKFLGSAPLGLYSKAYRLMLFPLRNISSVISRVMFPAFSTIQNDPDRIARAYLRMTRSIALITFPLMSGLVAVADHFVIAVFGNHWAEMIPILRLLAIVGMVQSIGTLNGNLYLSQGRTKLQLQVGSIIGILGVLAIVAGLQWGVIGVAMAYMIYSFMVFYPSIKIAVSLVNLTFIDVIKDLWGIFIISLLMGGIVYALNWMLPSFQSHWIYLIIQILAGITIYLAMIHLFGIRSYVEMRSLLLSKIKKDEY